MQVSCVHGPEMPPIFEPRKDNEASDCTVAETESGGMNEGSFMDSVGNSQSAFSRATACFRRRTTEKGRMKKVLSKPEDSDVPYRSSIAFYPEDRFDRALICCDASKLQDLRRKRADIAPISCREDDDMADLALVLYQESIERSMQSRREALKIHVKLLGKDHVDVKFFRQRIGRIQSHLSIIH
jgi:hypothetical protein